MSLYVHWNRRFIRDGSPGRPPRLSHSSWALKGTIPITLAFKSLFLGQDAVRYRKSQEASVQFGLLIFHLIFVYRFLPFNCRLSVVLWPDKGNYPETLQAVFWPKKQRSFLTFYVFGSGYWRSMRKRYRNEGLPTLLKTQSYRNYQAVPLFRPLRNASIVFCGEYWDPGFCVPCSFNFISTQSSSNKISDVCYANESDFSL